MAKLEVVIQNLVAAMGENGADISGSAFVYCDVRDMSCPLCFVTVPMGTEHRCTVKPAAAAPPAKRGRKRKAVTRA